ncbi:MAG: hypothetical protein QW118_05315 [Nitrososphaerota archaeon]
MRGARISRFAWVVKALNKTKLDFMLKVFGDGPFNLLGFLNKLNSIRVKIHSPTKSMPAIRQKQLYSDHYPKERFVQTVDEANALGVPAIVVEPWGLNFKERTRTLITKLSKSDEEIAAFLEKAGEQPKPKVQSWSQVVDLYIKALYTQ